MSVEVEDLGWVMQVLLELCTLLEAQGVILIAAPSGREGLLILHLVTPKTQLERMLEEVLIPGLAKIDLEERHATSALTRDPSERS